MAGRRPLLAGSGLTAFVRVSIKSGHPPNYASRQVWPHPGRYAALTSNFKADIRTVRIGTTMMPQQTRAVEAAKDPTGTTPNIATAAPSRTNRSVSSTRRWQRKTCKLKILDQRHQSAANFTLLSPAVPLAGSRTTGGTLIPMRRAIRL